MKATIIFFDGSSAEVKGKDLCIHMDGPQAYHLTDAYKNHRMLCAVSGVREIGLVGKAKKKKPAKPRIHQEELRITVDTQQLQESLKSVLIEMEDLVANGDFVTRDELAAKIRAEHPAVPADVAKAAELLKAELVIFKDYSTKGTDAGAFSLANPAYDVGFANGLRFAISKLDGQPPVMEPAPMVEVVMPSAKINDAKPAMAGNGMGIDEELPQPPKKPKELKEWQLAADPEPGQPARDSRCTCLSSRDIEARGHAPGCKLYKKGE